MRAKCGQVRTISGQTFDKSPTEAKSSSLNGLSIHGVVTLYTCCIVFCLPIRSLSNVFLRMTFQVVRPRYSFHVSFSCKFLLLQQRSEIQTSSCNFQHYPRLFGIQVEYIPSKYGPRMMLVLPKQRVSHMTILHVATCTLDIQNQTSQAFVTSSGPFCYRSCQFVYRPKNVRSTDASEIQAFQDSEKTFDNSPTDVNSSSLKLWSSRQGVDTLYNCCVVWFANSQYFATLFCACPSMS